MLPASFLFRANDVEIITQCEMAKQDIGQQQQKNKSEE